MIKQFAVLAMALWLASTGTWAQQQGADAQLQAAIASDHRTSAYVERDRFRHPSETLNFFGVAPDMTVVEIWPGGGWYTEILAPYLRGSGQLYAAHFPVQTEVAFFKRYRQRFVDKLSAVPQVYDRVVISEFHPPSAVSPGPQAAADRVLTFRNVHNWMKAGYASQAFKTFADLLKPGGMLGVVEHRAKPGTSEAEMISSGYVTEAYVIELAQAAGLVLDGRAEINANAKDSAQHPAGVWSLPPTLRLKEQDRDKYLAIGESDRMTLRFRKP